MVLYGFRAVVILQLIVYLITDDGQLNLLILTDSKELPYGTFDINGSGLPNTVLASEGWDGNIDNPSVFLTDFDGNNNYGACYYLMSGSVTILGNDDYLQITVNATTYNGSAFKATYIEGEVPTNTANIQKNSFARATENGIEVNAIRENVRIYNALGQIVYNRTVNGRTVIILPKQQVYTVRCGSQSAKIIL